jgi:hypothetical protein
MKTRRDYRTDILATSNETLVAQITEFAKLPAYSLSDRDHKKDNYRRAVAVRRGLIKPLFAL